MLTLIQIEKNLQQHYDDERILKEDNGSLPFKYLNQSGNQHVFFFYIPGVILNIFSQILVNYKHCRCS